MPDYSQLIFDPFAPDTITKLEQYEEFQFSVPDKPKMCAYIVLLYDINSDLKRNYPDNLYERKRNAALSAGFTITDGHFPGWVEDILVGDNDKFNDAALRFVRMFGLPDMPAYLAYTEILHKQVSAALKETDEKKLKIIQENIESSRTMVAQLERKMFGGEEVESVRAALYRLAEKQRLNLRPEHKAQQIETKTLSLPDPYYDKVAKKPGRPSKRSKELRGLLGVEGE